MFIYFTDHGAPRWVNVNNVMYFNGEYLYLINDKMVQIDKEFRDEVKEKLLKNQL